MYIHADMTRASSHAEGDDHWFRDQTARILHRHLRCGSHCRLDLAALLTRLARERNCILTNDRGALESAAPGYLS
jgi:hypothetical protein